MAIRKYSMREDGQMDETPSGRAVETRSPVVLDEAALDRYVRLWFRGGKRRDEVRCCIPLITRRHVLGTLNVGYAGERFLHI